MHCEAHPLKAWHYTDRFRARFGTVHWETARITVGISTSCVGAGPAASMALASKLLHATSGCDHMVAAVNAPVPGSVAEGSPTLPFGKSSASAIEAAGLVPTQEVLMPTVIRAVGGLLWVESLRVAGSSWGLWSCWELLDGGFCGWSRREQLGAFGGYGAAGSCWVLLRVIGWLLWAELPRAAGSFWGLWSCWVLLDAIEGDGGGGFVGWLGQRALPP